LTLFFWGGKEQAKKMKKLPFFEQSIFFGVGCKEFFSNKSLEGVDKAEKFSGARWSWGFAQVAIERNCEIIPWKKTKDNGGSVVFL